MSAVVATVVVAAIAAGGTITAAKMASDASHDASEAQKTASDKALAYAKQQDAYKNTTEANRYAAAQQQTAPFRAGSSAAGAQMAALLGQPAPPSGNSTPPPGYAVQPVPGMPAQTLPGGVGSPHPVQPGASPQAGDLIMMRAPDGTTKQVPAAERDHWISRGATPVNG